MIPRAKAREDVDSAVAYYAQEAGADVALAFIDALEQAYGFVGERPEAGSPRWAHELNLPGLRAVRLKGFPWIIFYFAFEAHVDVWRVLHAKRDMPAWLAEMPE